MKKIKETGENKKEMELDTLLEFLDIDDPAEFEYFENFADLIEMDGEISQEAIAQLISGASAEVVGDLAKQYFEDLLEHFPDDEPELFSLIESVKMALFGLGRRAQDERARFIFASELHRFRNWFRFESVVPRRERGGHEALEMPLFDALVLYRSEQLDGPADRYEYDFENCLDYQLDEYTAVLSDYWEDGPEDDDGMDEGE